jgi:hypothetical protein
MFVFDRNLPLSFALEIRKFLSSKFWSRIGDDLYSHDTDIGDILFHTSNFLSGKDAEAIFGCCFRHVILLKISSKY